MSGKHKSLFIETVSNVLVLASVCAPSFSLPQNDKTGHFGKHCTRRHSQVKLRSTLVSPFQLMVSLGFSDDPHKLIQAIHTLN
eukprot:3632602-Amphidinium_carterae.1